MDNGELSQVDVRELVLCVDHCSIDDGLALAPTDEAEFARVLPIVLAELRKYPGSVLTQLVDEIRICESISLGDATIAGAASGGGRLVYLAASIDGAPVSDFGLRLTLHHEISSAVFRSSKFVDHCEDWREALPRGFQYHETFGMTWREASRDPWYSRRIGRATAELGFACRYGEISVEEDFNTVAENLFAGTAEFWKLYDEHELLRRKVGMVVSAYRAWDSRFTLARFREYAAD